MPETELSTIYEAPKRPRAALTLAHGAGAGMGHEFLVTLSSALVKRGFGVLRFEFPYVTAGKRRPDAPKVATQAVATAVRKLRTHYQGPLFASGKSFGARMTTLAASEGLVDPVEGIICYGFPLHRAHEPSIERATHLSGVQMRMLFLQGTRDDLADLKLIRGVCKKLHRTTLHLVEEADHGFDVLKRSRRTRDEIIDELANQTEAFCLRHKKASAV